MRARAVLVLAALAVLVLSTTSARAADECRGLMVCIPVAGPWVVIPAGTTADRHPQRSWHMKCPPGSIVGGVDARLTDRGIDMSFNGLLGSPVNPGVTTTNEVVFTGTQTGRSGRPSSFRPFIGCIPTAGGGRVPTAVRTPTAVTPGRPTALRVRTTSLRSGQIVTLSPACSRGERMVSWTHAVALRQPREPTVAHLRAARSAVVTRAGQAAAQASLGGSGLRGRLQVVATCTRGPGQP